MSKIVGVSCNVFVSCFLLVISCYAQFGNSISGHVFGPQREPLSDITIELLDDFSRTIARTRTNASGRYFFNNISSGRYRIRILSLGTDFQEQEQDVEIQNFTRSDRGGGATVSGFQNVQQDFYLRARKSDPFGKAESVFVQEIPPNAKQLYDEAIQLLEKNDVKVGLGKLKNSIEAFPEYFQAIQRLGLEYIKQGHYQAAQILLQRAVEINSRSYISWYGLAYALYSLDYKDKALEAAQKATNLSPNSTESLLLTGTLLRLMGNYGESEKQLTKAKTSATQPIAEIHWQLALLYGNNLKRFAKAADELELFLKIRPNSKDAESIKKLIEDFRAKARNE